MEDIILVWAYPGPLYIDHEEPKAMRVARHSPCIECDCRGLHPPFGTDVIILETEDEGPLEEGLSMCECGHMWASHGDTSSLSPEEFSRRALVAKRADEFLQDDPDGRGLALFGYLNQDAINVLVQMIPFEEQGPREQQDSGESEEEDGSYAEQSSHGQKRSRASTSELSDAPPQESPVRKRKRVSSSPLSEQEEEAVEEEGKHVAGQKALPVMSGVRGNARAGKKRQAAANSTIGAKLNGLTNGVTHAPIKVKVEEDADDLISEADTVPSVDANATRASIDLPPKEKIVMAEHRVGYIQYAPVKNDGDPRSMIILVGLKCLFQRQLPKMPREYITRLVMDRSSVGLAMVKHGYKVVAGITYRPFPQRGFVEIVFCAVSSANQVKGYGGHLMDHFKSHIQEYYNNTVNYFLTYADNYAIGYFKKQGFSKDVTLARSQWAGYIKDYEGATLLQCTLVPKVDYTTIRDILTIQKAVILARIKERSSSHVVRRGIERFETEPNAVLDYSEVPGLMEAGWTANVEEEETRPQVARPPRYVRMTRALRALQSHPQSWPFRTPVNRNEVPDYYEVIAHPMDFHTMQVKLEEGKYDTTQDFVRDVNLIIDNCLQYNPKGSVYATGALKLRRYFVSQLTKELAGEELE